MPVCVCIQGVAQLRDVGCAHLWFAPCLARVCIPKGLSSVRASVNMTILLRTTASQKAFARICFWNDPCTHLFIESQFLLWHLFTGHLQGLGFFHWFKPCNLLTKTLEPPIHLDPANNFSTPFSEQPANKFVFGATNSESHLFSHQELILRSGHRILTTSACILPSTKLPSGISGLNSKFCRISGINSRIQQEFWDLYQFRWSISVELHSSTVAHQTTPGCGQNWRRSVPPSRCHPYSGLQIGRTDTCRCDRAARPLSRPLEGWQQEGGTDQRQFWPWPGVVWSGRTLFYRNRSSKLVQIPEFWLNSGIDAGNPAEFWILARNPGKQFSTREDTSAGGQNSEAGSRNWLLEAENVTFGVAGSKNEWIHWWLTEGSIKTCGWVEVDWWLLHFVRAPWGLEKE